MPKIVGQSNDGIIFIVGDPRSKQNLSKIRRHASKARRSDARAVTPPDVSKKSPISSAGTPKSQTFTDRSSPLPELERSYTPPARGSLNTFRLSSADGSRRTFSEHAVLRGCNPSLPRAEQATMIETLAGRYHLEGATPKSDLLGFERPTPNAWNRNSSPNFNRQDPSLLNDQQQESYPLPLRPTKRSKSFTTMGTAIGTWFENHPTMQAAATFDFDFDPHKRARLSSQENPRDSINKFLPIERSIEIPPLDLVYAASRQRSGTSILIRQHSSLDGLSATAEESQQRKRKSDALYTQWRIFAAPSRPLALSATHNSFEHVLLRTNAYYTSRFDSTWQPQIIRNSQALDSDGRIASLYESNLTIAALIEAGRPAFADLIIQRNMSVMEELLRSEHPRLYSVLSVMALDTTPSVLGQFHEKFVEAIVPLARKVLGDEHPCTILLQCDLPLETKARLLEAVQRRIHELHLATFGDVHQTYEGAFIVGRILAQLGQIGEALGVLAWLKPRWEGAHGMNSMLAVWILLDEAGIFLGAGRADVRTEMIISDALRRLKVLESNSRDLSGPERLQHLMGLTYLQVGAIRAIGKMHVMRKNYGAALESYRQAVNLGRDVFGPNAPSTQLAQGDYDRAIESGLELWTADYSPPEDVEEEIEIVETVLGKIARSKAAFGREARKVPVDKAPVYGLVPYENLKWREGVGAP